LGQIVDLRHLSYINDVEYLFYLFIAVEAYVLLYILIGRVHKYLQTLGGNIMNTKEERTVERYETSYKDRKKILIIHYDDGTKKEVVKDPLSQ